MYEKWKRYKWILCLTAAFAALAGVGAVTMSRYTAQALGTGTAAVAAFVSESTITVPVPLLPEQPGGKSETQFRVTNFKGDAISDVTQDYSITIRSTGNLPYTYMLSGENKNQGEGINNSVIMMSAPVVINTPVQGGVLPHTEKVTHTYTLTIQWPEAKRDPAYSGEVEYISIEINSMQKLAEK